MRGILTIFRSGPEDAVTAWINGRVRAIRVCLDSNLPEAAITLIYAGIDTIGLLNAPEGHLDATRESFLNWSETYLIPLLHTIDGDRVTGIDLYAARCGILHISSPISKLARENNAREIWYQFRAETGGHPFAVPNRRELPLLIELEDLEHAFRQACKTFLSDLKCEQARFERAIERVKQLLAWGIGSVMSDEDVRAYLANRRNHRPPSSQ